MGRQVTLRFGALVGTIAEQIAAQGLRIDAAECDRFQGHASAITRLAIHGVLTDAEARRARQRLIKQVVGTVTEASHG